MGKINGLNQDPTGMVGNIVYRQTKKGTIIAKQPRKASTPRRSEKQMFTRCQFANLAANFRLFEGRLALAFEDKTASQSEFNLYLQCNYGVTNAVFITKQERLNGACVLAPYQFTRGTIKSVGYALDTNGKPVTNINLGPLQITAETTVAQFTQAVRQNNARYQENDQITFFYAEQDSDPMTGVPRASMDSWRVALDSQDETPLYNVVNPLGFTSIHNGTSYMLGMNAVLHNAGVAWAHSRESADGIIKVGTQRLLVVSDILPQYQTTAAWKASADSYGGVNTKPVYLNPNSSVDAFGTDYSGSTSGASGGSGTSQGSNTGGGTSTGGNTGGNTGGGDNGDNGGGDGFGS